MEKNTQLKIERAITVGVNFRGDNSRKLTVDQSLNELELLAETAGIEVIASITQNLDSPNSRTYIGKGKLEEVKLLASEVDADLILFDDELSPRHQREIEEEFLSNVKILDRTALILDIFAQHANTREGMLQVELAQLKYRLPRLTRAWTHLARQAGGAAGRTGGVGGVGLRGPGEMQIEIDRREIKKRISHLEDELDKVRDQRSRYRDHRRKTNIPVVALVGYTNAGKSTLLNKLTDAGIYVADKLFATLDPTTRQLELPSGVTILITDTVGFIQKLPTQLVAAFRATLEEIVEANLLLHVVDASHENAQIQKITVLETLKELGAGDLPILTVYNKVDLLDDLSKQELSKMHETNGILISAKDGFGLDELKTSISRELYAGYINIRVCFPYEKGQLVSLFHEKGHVTKIDHLENCIQIEGKLPEALLGYFEDYLK